MAEAKSHPLISHAQPRQKKKIRIWRGRRQRHGWIVVGLRMSIFETHTLFFCFSCSRKHHVLSLTLQDRIQMGSMEKMWYWRITFTLCIMKDNREVTLLQSHETLNHGAYINLLYVWVMSILHSTISQTTTLSGGLTPLTSPYSASPKPRGVFTGFPLNTGHILDLYI